MDNKKQKTIYGEKMKQGIHITHEAAKKIGGIGSVLSGMCTSETYLQNFEKTIFYGPLFEDQPNPDYSENIAINRLGKNAKILFSSLDNISKSAYDIFFHNLIKKYNIEIVYGEKTLFDEIYPDKKNTIEILLIGVKAININLLNIFKFKLWDIFNFPCQNYENDWDFEQYLRIALPYREICDEFFDKNKETIHFSHEYMGILSCLAIHLEKRNLEKIYFHAHEISTARNIVESLPAHDINFYKYINKDLADGIAMEDRYGSYHHLSRNELIKLTTHFDGVLAVGDWVKKEYKYLIPHADTKKIHICYNGTPTPNFSYSDKLKARKKIQNYCDNLYNFTPDIIMTHVTRLVVSKGLWRDISILEELDKKFTKDNLKGFCVILSSLIGTGRTEEEIAMMEQNYGWPVMHKSGYPDLIDYENDLYWSCLYFNAKSKSIKIVFINQFGFTPERIGERLPKGTTFADLRLASDAEFGMSIYEPFGIAQIETIPFGGVAILTRACGSSFLLEKTFLNEKIKPFYIFDFAQKVNFDENINCEHITHEERDKIEKLILKKNIDKVYKLIPKSDIQRKEVFNLCKKYMNKITWNEVIKDFFLI